MLKTSKKLREENLALREQVRELAGIIANLELKVRALELARALPRKIEDDRQCFLEIVATESVSIEQDEAEAETQSEPTIPSSTTPRKGKKRLTPAEKFESLPISRETILIPDEVKADPEAWEELDDEVTYEVLVHPTKLTRHKIVRKKFRRKADRDQAPIIAKAPIRFSASYVSISLAVYIVLSKYLEHGALYRLERKFIRLGADIPRQSQSDAVERFALWMRPLYELIDRRARASGYLQIDDGARSA